MEPNDIQTALSAAVQEVLETMCFATVLDSAEGIAPSDSDSPPVMAELRFGRIPAGEFRVIVPLGLGRLVSADFLGCERTEVSKSDVEDVVCELANMFCGSALSRLESEACFQITHPELVPPERGMDVGGADANRWFDLGDGVLSVSMEFQQAL